jgi:hypothetical protein
MILSNEVMKITCEFNGQSMGNGAFSPSCHNFTRSSYRILDLDVNVEEPYFFSFPHLSKSEANAGTPPYMKVAAKYHV